MWSQALTIRSLCSGLGRGGKGLAPWCMAWYQGFLKNAQNRAVSALGRAREVFMARVEKKSAAGRKGSGPGRAGRKAVGKESVKKKKARAERINELLAEEYPEAGTALHHRNAYELLVATILSAQCTDERVNQVCEVLFVEAPDPKALDGMDQARLEEIIRPTGFYRNKAKHLKGTARALVERFGGAVPDSMEDLTSLPGVARKTANVVLGSFFGKPEGVVVDTHVRRLSGRLGLTESSDPVRIERDLMELLPREEWIGFSHRLVWHGRRVCKARKPRCSDCILAPLCPSAGR